jgi:hypothetical protein
MAIIIGVVAEKPAASRKDLRLRLSAEVYGIEIQTGFELSRMTKMESLICSVSI